MVDARLVLATLPLVAVAISRRRETADDEVLVPVVVNEYLESMSDDRWYDRAMLPDIVTHAARTAGPHAALLALQGWVLRSAWATLGDWWGQEHAGWHQDDITKRRAAGRDWESAAQELFGCAASMLDWVGPHDDWLAVWRTSGTSDPAILEHAGLGERELELLEVRGEC